MTSVGAQMKIIQLKAADKRIFFQMAAILAQALMEDLLIKYG